MNSISTEQKKQIADLRKEMAQKADAKLLKDLAPCQIYYDNIWTSFNGLASGKEEVYEGAKFYPKVAMKRCMLHADASGFKEIKEKFKRELFFIHARQRNYTSRGAAYVRISVGGSISILDADSDF